jgi:putative ABC transport system permease protein
MLSVRTALLRRGRLALSVGMLAVGGAVFMSALNVSGAWNRAVDKDFRSRHYDLTAILGRPYPIERLESLLATVPGVARAEYWPGGNPYLVGEDGAAGNPVALLGIEPESRLLDLPLRAGRWLLPDDARHAVVNQAVVRRLPSLQVGGDVRLRFEERTVSLTVVGLVDELTPAPIVYAPRPAVLEAAGLKGDVARTVRIVTEPHDDATQRAVASRLETAFQESGIEVSGLTRMLDARKAVLDHLVIVMAVLTMAAVIVVFVGGLGLTSTLTLSVIQRTREIGILGALGATPGTIARHVWFESVFMGLSSWVISILLAAPASYVLESVTGRIFFRAPLDFFVSAAAAGIWLALVVVLASLCSTYPALRAARLTVREALAYA